LKVMVIGGGGREHALTWKIAQSPKVEKVFVAPGNAGTALIAETLSLQLTDIEALGKAAKNEDIDLAVVGPETALASGIVDYFDSLGIPIFGSTKAATQIESSKVFARDLMQKYGISCPKGVVFSSYPEAREYLKQQQPPIVIKADGLAAGKGTIIANSTQEASKALSDIMEAKVFGSAGDKVIIDEYVTGREVSLIAFTDGKTVSPMVPACDYKKVWDNDQGPNTGGMGSYSPPGFFSTELIEKATNTILLPAVSAMANEGITHKGVLYAGLMVVGDKLLVLEFNARFGDPETQVILPLLKTDLIDILLAVIQGNLDQVKIEWNSNACVGVVMASAGYPGSYKRGFPIEGLDKFVAYSNKIRNFKKSYNQISAKAEKDLLVFHAGTKLGDDGKVYTNGGRVLTVVGTGKNMAEARAKVYRNITNIYFKGCHYRRDIALREIS
jgi:phosphoribosylamine--glycine ligase